MKFAISYTEKGKAEKTKILQNALNNRTFFYTLLDLKPETSYTVKVYGHSGAKKSMASNEVEATTLAVVSILNAGFFKF